MSLKSDIVIVNEFTVAKGNGRGSRGGTPGSYITSYMARELAVETLAPIQRHRLDDFVMRYMARESAVENLDTTPRRLKKEMRKAQGDGGVSFGYGSVSLSHEQLAQASADIQRLFDQGHTVMKTVLSFDEEYLRRHGLIPETFEPEQRGDYRGQLDQMKLRLAVMQGLKRMAAGTSGFDDLRYVGVIQVDTMHVHCHLAMVDAGPGSITADGTQRGKLLDRHKSRLRRGVDAWLDEKQTVRHMSSAVGFERRNVQTFIKRWAHERMREESLPQFLIACLPEDRRLWRAKTNDPRMRKANVLITELVTEQLQRPGSPLPDAHASILEYANERRRREGLSSEQWGHLVRDGQAQVVERAVNGVYQLLRALPPDAFQVRTPMLDMMSMDYTDLVTRVRDQAAGSKEDESVLFAFRLRNYGSRLARHREQAVAYRDLADQWEMAERRGVALLESKPLHDFHRTEERYHRKLLAKYQHFLPFVGDAERWYERQAEVADYGQRIIDLTSLSRDESLRKMKDPEAAEQLGRMIYGQSGGREVVRGAAGRAVLDKRIAVMRENHTRQLAELRADLSISGLVLEPMTEDDAAQLPLLTPGANRRRTARRKPASAITRPEEEAEEAERFQIVPGTAYPFDEVKGLDLHELGFDFFTDVAIGERAQRTFIQEARLRREMMLGAMRYLDQSGQSQAITDLPVADVTAMNTLATQIERQRRQGSGEVLLTSRLAELRESRAAAKRSAATRLDAALATRVKTRIDQAAQEISEHPEKLRPTTLDLSE